MNRAARIRAWMRQEWPIFATVTVGALAYANTLGHGFVWDDLIILDQRVRYYRSPLDAFFEPADIPGFPGVFRPLTFASFWLDQLVWWRNAFGFHLTSVVLHALNGALVYLLARRLGCSARAALVGALLFAVHPVHAEAVAWITARVDVLATTFALLTVLAALRAAASDTGTRAAETSHAATAPRAHRAARRERRAAASSRAQSTPPSTRVWPWVAIAVCSFAAAASKEPGMLVPLLVLAATTLPARRRNDAVVDKGVATGDHTAASDHTASGRRRAAWLATAASAAGVTAYVVVRALNRGNDEGHLGALDAANLVRLVRAFGFYVERLLVPVGLRAYVPEVPRGSIVLVWALLGVVAVALVPRAPRARFAVLWILVTLAPSMLVAIADISVTAVAERYLYLPSVGLALLVALALDRVPRDRARMALVPAAAILALLAVATVQRNPVWRDEIALWTDVTRQEHAFALPYMNLGLALANDGRLDEAEPAYRAALAARSSPTTTRDTWVNLGHLELRRNRLDEALAAFTHANALAPHASAHYGIGAVYRARARAALDAGDEATARADFARAQAALTAALAINPRHYNSQYLLGSVLYQSGDLNGALEHFHRAAELAPDTDVGARSVQAARELEAWLADPAHRAGLAER